MDDLENTQRVAQSDVEEALLTIEGVTHEDLGEHNIGAARDLVARLRDTADAVEGNIRGAENWAE